MSIKNGVLGVCSSALLASFIAAPAAVAGTTRVLNHPLVVQIDNSTASTVTDVGFLDQPFEHDFLERFRSISDDASNHVLSGKTVPGPTAIFTAGVGLMMLGRRRRLL